MTICAKPFACVLVGVIGHSQNSKIVIKNLQNLHQYLATKRYPVRQVTAIYKNDEFHGGVLIEFGEDAEACYWAFKLQAEFQSKGHGLEDWCCRENLTGPCLWVFGKSYIHYTTTPRELVLVPETVIAWAQYRVQEASDGVQGGLAATLESMYPMSIQCATPYTCAVTGLDIKLENGRPLKKALDRIHDHLLGMGYDVDSVEPAMISNLFTGIILIELGQTDQARFSAFKLRAQFSSKGFSPNRPHATDNVANLCCWVTDKTDRHLFPRAKRTVHVPRSIITKAEIAGSQEEDSLFQELREALDKLNMS